MRIQVIFIILFISSISFGQDTIGVQQNPFELEQLKGREVNTNQNLDLNPGSSNDDNPFEVNHIPIRKNQIARGSKKDIDSKPFHTEHFPLIVIITLLIFLAGILSKQRDILNIIVSAAVRDYALTDFLKAENDGKSTIVRLSGVFAILSAGLFITLTCSQYTSMTVWSMFAYVVGGIFIWYITKDIILSILKYAFSVKSLVNFYLAQIKVWNIIMGIALLFFSIFIAYGPTAISNTFVYLGLGVIGFCSLAKLFKVLTYSIASIFNQPLQFFIYLCAFEISPIIMLVRFLHILY